MASTAYRRYLLAILMVMLVFNNMDPLALGLALQNIKVDLHLTDTQLGLITGIAFAFFYAVMGIPIARWADRGNRVSVIAVTAALWSLMVAATGRATNFVQLLCVRSAVAIGEAGCVPPANSLIPDYFSRSERAKAAGLYMAGSPLSAIIGYPIAGWLIQVYGWRTMFLLIGLPGLGLAVLAKLTLREPRLARPPAATLDSGGALGQGAISAGVGPAEQSPSNEASSSSPAPSILQVCASLWSNSTFRHLLASFSVMSFFGSGLAQWQPTYFIRSYGLTTGELGTWAGLINGGMALLGSNVGGVLASRYAAHNEGLQFKAMGAACASLAFVYSGVYLIHNYFVDFALSGIAAFGFATLSGPMYGAIQSLVPSGTRAVVIAVLSLFSSLVGLGMGPLVAGALSDALHPMLGQESLRYALTALCPGYMWVGWHLWRASKTVTADIETLRDGSGHTRECGQLS